MQAVLHRYETFHRADGHTVKLPMDRGEGQHWNLAPGNFYSRPQNITIGRRWRTNFRHRARPGNSAYPAARRTPNTSAISDSGAKSLSKFWGRPMYLGANVLVPEGFDEHPKTHYPLVVFHDHFSQDFDGFRTEPPDPNLKPDYSERFHISGYNRIQQEEALQVLSTMDRAPNFPRLLIVKSSMLIRITTIPTPLIRPTLALRRCYRNGTDPRDRKAVSRHWARMGALSLRRLHRRLGSARRADCSIRTTTTALSSPVPIRSTSAPSRRSTFTRTRTPFTSKARTRAWMQPGMRNYLGQVTATPRPEPLRAGAWDKRALRRAIRYLAGRLFARGRRRLSASLFSIKRLV